MAHRQNNKETLGIHEMSWPVNKITPKTMEIQKKTKKPKARAQNNPKTSVNTKKKNIGQLWGSWGFVRL